MAASALMTMPDAEKADAARGQHLELAAVAAERIGGAAAHEQRRGVDVDSAAGDDAADEILAGIERDEPTEPAADGAVGR